MRRLIGQREMEVWWDLPQADTVTVTRMEMMMQVMPYWTPRGPWSDVVAQRFFRNGARASGATAGAHARVCSSQCPHLGAVRALADKLCAFFKDNPTWE